LAVEPKQTGTWFEVPVFVILTQYSTVKELVVRAKLDEEEE
jgi:hypothetical protein